MPAPDWDLEQLEVILENTSSWQLVAAGPGAGKSAVACQRIAYLIDEGVPASRVLLVSFTRTAVAELRDRIVMYAVAGEQARRVRISTIDSNAWSLRAGFEGPLLRGKQTQNSYDLNIVQTTALIKSANIELHEFIATLEHVIIDEAQDVMSVRAEFIMALLGALSPSCGVTILADPAQAIYGFTTDEHDDTEGGLSLLERLAAEPPRPLTHRTLKGNHRVESAALADVFLRARKEIELADTADGHVDRVQQAIRNACGNDIGVSSYSTVADFLSRNATDSMLVLYRRRADVLFASSYCSEANVEHRLRMSGTPIVVRPWIGWLFGEHTQSFIERDDFNHLWQARADLASQPLAGVERDAAWSLLHRLAADRGSASIDLEILRGLVSRSRPPIELCESDVGYRGPILGTIHASKGREADTVVLVMPHPVATSSEAGDTADSDMFEEGRVYYVGATRARKMLIAAGCSATGVSYLDSKRIYRTKGSSVQLEIGRMGDVDVLAHLAWSNAREVQHALALHAGKTAHIHARALEENGYAWRLMHDRLDPDGVTRPTEIGQLSASFKDDLGRLWSRIDTAGRLRPKSLIPYLHLVGISTIGITEENRWAVKYPYKQSGLALAPVIKGFSPIQFLTRARRGSQA
jgi:hypothetical protein